MFWREGEYLEGRRGAYFRPLLFKAGFKVKAPPILGGYKQLNAMVIKGLIMYLKICFGI